MPILCYSLSLHWNSVFFLAVVLSWQPYNTCSLAECNVDQNFINCQLSCRYKNAVKNVNIWLLIPLSDAFLKAPTFASVVVYWRWATLITCVGETADGLLSMSSRIFKMHCCCWWNWSLYDFTCFYLFIPSSIYSFHRCGWERLSTQSQAGSAFATSWSLSLSSSSVLSSPPHRPPSLFFLLPGSRVGPLSVGSVDFSSLRLFLVFSSPKFLYSLCLRQILSNCLFSLCPLPRLHISCLRQTGSQSSSSSSSPVHLCVPL